MSQDNLEWIEQESKTNMNLLIDIIELKVKENGMADRANDLPSMERVQIAYIFLAITGYGEGYIRAVTNQIDWAIGTQAEETLYHPKPGKGNQKSSIRLMMYYKMALNKRGVRVHIDEEERKKRKENVSKRRKEIKEFERER